MTTIKVGKLRYDPDAVLGKGNGTTVFRGTFRKGILGSDEPVAVKRIPKNDISLREVEIMKKTTDNPHILRLIHAKIKDDFL